MSPPSTSWLQLWQMQAGRLCAPCTDRLQQLRPDVGAEQLLEGRGFCDVPVLRYHASCSVDDGAHLPQQPYSAGTAPGSLVDLTPDVASCAHSHAAGALQIAHTCRRGAVILSQESLWPAWH